MTVSIRTIIDPQKLADYVNDGNGPVVRELLRKGDLVKDEAKRLVGVYEPPPDGPGRDRRPGQLRDSIVKRLVDVGGKVQVEVGSEDEIALLHHEGTPPHVITPVRAPRLVFWSGRQGRVVYATRVQHPGTRPNRFLTDALRVL